MPVPNMIVVARVCLQRLAALTMACILLAIAAPPAAAQTAPSQVTRAAQQALPQTTLNKIRERGSVSCGVSDHLPGFSDQDEKGVWTGFDVDFCRALAAAIFDDPSKVVLIPVSAETSFAPLVAGTIDVLSRNTTWTLGREAGFGIQFPTVTYYDSQGFMVRKSRDATSARDLDGAKICVARSTTTELNLADYFRANRLNYTGVPLATGAEVVKAYDDGRCDAVTGDISQLHAARLLLRAPDDHVILPDTISKEPLGPAVRDGDNQWLNLVKWTHFAMVDAEELGVTQKTLAESMASGDAEVKRLLGTYGALGEALGLTNDWAARIIRHVGNYGETFERNIGSGSRLAIARGMNRLWNDGGIQYAPPIR